ncbi:MAG: quinone oxidoreductase [Pseudomonadota bacterium]
MADARIIRFHETGGPEVLKEESELVDAPGPAEVIVRNTAIGLNFIDTYHRTGLYPVELPFIPGTEGAGVIEAVGSDVTHVSEGDRVAYLAPGGAYSTHAKIPAGSVVALPDSVDDETAAATFLKGLTAWMLLFEVYKARPGDTALIWAAAGGVGSLIVPWAASLGVTVIGIVSTKRKADRIIENGASHAVLVNEDIPARVKDLTEGKGVDVAYDSVGKDSAELSIKSLRPRGWFVTYGNASGPVDPISPGRLGMAGSAVMTRPSLFDFVSTPEEIGRGAAALFGALRVGTIKADVGQRYSLSDAAEAHRALEARQTMGSTVLLP